MEEIDKEDILVMLGLMLILRKKRKKRQQKNERARKKPELPLRLSTVTGSKYYMNHKESVSKGLRVTDAKNIIWHRSQKLTNWPLSANDDLKGNEFTSNDAIKVKREINPCPSDGEHKCFQEEYASEEDDINADSPAVEVKIEAMDDWNSIG